MPCLRLLWWYFQIFYPFFIELYVFLLLGFENLCLLDTSTLSELRLTKISPSEKACLFHSLNSIIQRVEVFYFFLFIEFIGVTLANRITQVQMHSSTTHHLYIALCTHHFRSNLRPPPFICPTPSPSPSPPPPPLYCGSHHTAFHIREFLLCPSAPFQQLSACSLWVCHCFWWIPIYLFF